MKHSGKIATFERIRKNYGNFLEAVLWKLTGDRELFAEAYQNALLVMWQHIAKLDNDQPGGYIYRIALSSVQKAWRDKKGGNIEFPDNLTSHQKSPLEKIVKNEDVNVLRQAISELPDQQGKAVVMRYLESKSYSELAHQLNCSEAAARSHVSNAIAALKKKMNRFFEREKSHE
ncbi:RNA polymerase sigma factor [Planctomycetota bacterium]